MAFGSIRLPCTFCGQEVRRTPSKLAAAGGRAYCSPECYRADPNKPPRRQRSDSGTRRSPHVTLPCVTCGAPVERRASEVMPRVFCSRACNGAQAKKEGRPGRPGRRPVGSTRPTREGYVMVLLERGHPMANGKGECAEHRFVMAEHLGRPLLPTENVHHINGVRSDNRLENLELWVRSQPQGQRAVDMLAWAREIIDTYEPIADRL